MNQVSKNRRRLNSCIDGECGVESRANPAVDDIRPKVLAPQYYRKNNILVMQPSGLQFADEPEHTSDAKIYLAELITDMHMSSEIEE